MNTVSTQKYNYSPTQIVFSYKILISRDKYEKFMFLIYVPFQKRMRPFLNATSNTALLQ